MKSYLVTFKNRKTGVVLHEETLEYDDDTDFDSLRISIVFLALDKMKSKGIPLPNPKKYSWSFSEI